MSSQQVIWGSLIGGVVGRETLNVTLTSEKTFVIPSNLPPRRLKSKSGFESASQDPTPGADAPSTGIPRLPVSVSRHRGYVVGRDADCDIVVEHPDVSRRHFLVFPVNRHGRIVPFVQGLSETGTMVDRHFIGFDRTVELRDGYTIEISPGVEFIFNSAAMKSFFFHDKYFALQQISKLDHWTYLHCREKTTGNDFTSVMLEDVTNCTQIYLTTKVPIILMGLCHPNIVTLIEVFQDPPTPVYILEPAAARLELFHEIFTKVKLREDETRKIFRQLFAAVKYLHDRNIAHRDIKLESIYLVDDSYKVKLGNFHLATYVRTGVKLSQLCGTPNYMAPEVLVKSRLRQYDHSVDIWALGVVLYICLCGFWPFSPDRTSVEFPFTLNEQIKKAMFSRLSPNVVSNTAFNLIESMLVVDPDCRFTINDCLSHPWLRNVMDTTWSLSTPLPPGTAFPQIPSILPSQPSRNSTLMLMTTAAPESMTATDTPIIVENTLSSTPTLRITELEHIPDEAVRLDDLTEEQQDDMRLDDYCWTFACSGEASNDQLPLTLDGCPIVVPVRSQYPLVPLSSPPPDPHPRIISPLEAISEETANEILDLFKDATGFYILLNGYLQIIVPDDFNYKEALPILPHEFGGLKVTFIRHSLYPTADNLDGSLTSAPTVQHSRGSRTGTATGLPVGSGASNGTEASPPEVISTALAPAVEDRSATARFKRTLGSSIRVSVKGIRSNVRYEGKVGVLVSPRNQEGKVYATVPTHLFTDAVSVSKVVSLESKEWVGAVRCQMARTSTDLGELFQVFDPGPQAFPIGFTHDTSLINVSHIPAAARASTSSTIEWLDHHEWVGIRYTSSDLVLLDGDGEPREAKSIAVTDSRCQIVGQGIFRIHQETKPRPSFLKSLTGSSSSASDARDELSTWTALVARSILYRVRHDSAIRGGQSGTPLCILRPIQAGAASDTRTAKVVGFASFVQMVSDVQRYEMEGDKLYKRLQEGRVAFYGAFQLPKELTEGYHII